MFALEAYTGEPSAVVMMQGTSTANSLREEMMQ